MEVSSPWPGSFVLATHSGDSPLKFITSNDRLMLVKECKQDEKHIRCYTMMFLVLEIEPVFVCFCCFFFFKYRLQEHHQHFTTTHSHRQPRLKLALGLQKISLAYLDMLQPQPLHTGQE